MNKKNIPNGKELKDLMNFQILKLNNKQKVTGNLVTIDNIIKSILEEEYKNTDKTNRPLILSCDCENRITGSDAFDHWTGFAVIDMDIKNREIALELKQFLIEKVGYKEWLLGIFLSTSGNGLHIYTKTQIPERCNRPNFVDVNFMMKTSFIYSATLLKYNDKNLVDKWFDISTRKPQQGIFITADKDGYINPKFDDIHLMTGQDFDIDTLPLPDQTKIYNKDQQEKDTSDPVDLSNISIEIPKNIKKCHLAYHELYSVINSLVYIYGYDKALEIANEICIGKEKSEIIGMANTARRHNKKATEFGLWLLKEKHNFKVEIKRDIKEDFIKKLHEQINKVSQKNAISTQGIKNHNFKLSSNEYLSHKTNEILDIIDKNQITILNAPAGIGKTEFVKKIAEERTKKDGSKCKVALLEPYVSILNNKIPKDSGWQIGSQGNAIDISKDTSVAITFDKYAHIGAIMFELERFDYIFIDESHLLFVSKFRDIMSKVIDNIKIQQGAKVVLMSGTPTGEYEFFGDNPWTVSIKVTKEETRFKNFTTHILERQCDLYYVAGKYIQKSIEEGYTIICPTNRGNQAYSKLKTYIDKFGEKKYNYVYYKKENDGLKEMDNITFDARVGDLDVVVASSYLSCGIDIKDKTKKFRYVFLEAYSAFEVEQWINRVRGEDIDAHLFLPIYDKNGFCNFVSSSNIDYKVNEIDMAFFNALDKTVFKFYDNKSFEVKFNIILQQLIKAGYMKWSEINACYKVDNEKIRLERFEDGIRAYYTQPIVLLACMQDYGYKLNFEIEDKVRVDSAFKREIDKAVKKNNKELKNIKKQALEDILNKLSEEDGVTKYIEPVTEGRVKVLKSKEWKITPKTIRCPYTTEFQLVLKCIYKLKNYFNNPIDILKDILIENNTITLDKVSKLILKAKFMNALEDQGCDEWTNNLINKLEDIKENGCTNIEFETLIQNNINDIYKGDDEKYKKRIEGLITFTIKSLYKKTTKKGKIKLEDIQLKHRIVDKIEYINNLIEEFNF